MQSFLHPYDPDRALSEHHRILFNRRAPVMHVARHTGSLWSQHGASKGLGRLVSHCVPPQDLSIIPGMPKELVIPVSARTLEGAEALLKRIAARSKEAETLSTPLKR